MKIEPEYNPADDIEYQKFISLVLPFCKCTGVYRPCDGLLAGGMCDDLHFGTDYQDRDSDPDEIDLTP